MAAAAVAVGIAGLALQAKGMIDARRDAADIAAKKRAAAQFEAAQLEQQAGQEEAASQRTVFEEGRTSKLVQSRALALAAASGGSASDPTVVKIISGIASEGAYRQNLAIYQGEEKARQLRLAAKADIMSGDIGAAATVAQGKSLFLQGAGSLASSGATMFSRYGYGRPGSAAARAPSADFTGVGDFPAAPTYG